MCTTDDKVCRLRNMFCKIKYIAFKIKILTVLLLCRSFANCAKFLRTPFFKRTSLDQYFCNEYLVRAIVLEQLARTFSVQAAA